MCSVSGVDARDVASRVDEVDGVGEAVRTRLCVWAFSLSEFVEGRLSDEDIFAI